MRVGPGVNELCGHAHPVPCSLHAPFKHVSNAELLGDFAKVVCRRILVLHHTCAANYFQVGYLGEIRKNFVLNPLRKISVFFLVTEIFEWKHGYAFFWNRCRSIDLGWLATIL